MNAYENKMIMPIKNDNANEKKMIMLMKINDNANENKW